MFCMVDEWPKWTRNRDTRFIGWWTLTNTAGWSPWTPTQGICNQVIDWLVYFNRRSRVFLHCLTKKSKSIVVQMRSFVIFWMHKITISMTSILLKEETAFIFPLSDQPKAFIIRWVMCCLITHKLQRIYTTKGRDRFHWAATPLKPYKVGNICYIVYDVSV